jgi:lipopolysaccharide exporter
VLLILGPKWVEAVQLIQILAFFGITQVMQSNAYSAFIALGKPEVFVKINMIHVGFLLTALTSFTWLWGLRGAAWAYVGTAIVMLPVNFIFITRYLEIHTADLFAHLWRPLAASALMYLGVRALGPELPQGVIPSAQAATSLLASVTLGVVLYPLATLILWQLSGRPEGAETTALQQLRAVWTRARLKLRPDAS